MRDGDFGLWGRSWWRAGRVGSSEVESRFEDGVIELVGRERG